jgi:hypothetical protein
MVMENKIENSVYHKFILDCIAKGLSTVQIRKALLEKGYSLSLPTIRKFMVNVKKKGVNAAQFESNTQSAALAINDKIKSIPELTSIFSRRNYLIDTLLDRRKKLIEFSDEGKRSAKLFEDLKSFQEFIQHNKNNFASEEQYQEIYKKINDLITYCNINFTKNKMQPAVEDLIRKYTMDINDICKYIEQWTSKYEIELLMEKLCEMITKAALSTFGELLRRETEEYRQKYVKKFIDEVEKSMEDIKDYELKLEENRNA